ncbi:MAG TPA: metallophosphoesterase [Pseudorhodoplanes sp.]|nr:metallophosphoesterase [Pseudorhodoplanes sp.]
MFTLAHLSDPHLGPLPRANVRELSGKRAIGFINWHRRRKTFHRGDILEQILQDLKSHRPDHVAVTGDLVNLALPAEFAPALQWLRRVGDPKDVTIVPGNHDLYVRTAMHDPHTHWGEYMLCDSGGHFPFVRRRGPLALVGLSSAIPTAPFMATGRVGASQLARLASLLTQLADESRFRVVLIHHPPMRTRGDRFKRLIDSAALRAVLAERGAELVLHGHDHVHSVRFLDGANGRIPVVGVPSASSRGGEASDPAAYHLYRIDGAPGAWRCEAVTRGLRRGLDGVGEIAKRVLIG